MVLAARRRAEAGKAAGCRQAGMTAKARFEMCGDAGIVLRQEISHREIDGVFQKSDACQNEEEPALQYLRNIACDISWRRGQVGRPIKVISENMWRRRHCFKTGNFS